MATDYHDLTETGAQLDTKLGQAHTQGTDPGLDAGGTNPITAADLKTFKESQLYNGLHTPTDWTLSYVPGTRIITAVVGADTQVNADGEILTVSAATYTETHAAATGIYYLVIESDGTMRFDNTFDFLSEAIVAYVYYNHTETDGILFDERHPADPGWPASVHRHDHETVGAVIVSGGAITGITEDSNANADMQLSISQVVFDDESLRVTLAALTSGDGKYTIFHRSGADGDNEWSCKTGENLPVYVSNLNPTYNYFNAGNWSLAEIDSNSRWVNYYLIATNAIETDYQYLLIPGQEVHSTLGAAEAEDFIGSINFGDFPIAEIVPLAKLTIRRATGTGNNFYIDEWINLRGTRVSLSVSTIPASHNSLADRDAAGSHPASAISYGEESDVDTELGLKADKVTSATAGNLAELDADGNLVDSETPASALYDLYPIEVNPTLDLDFANQTYKSYVDHSGLVEWSLSGVDSKLTFTRATTKTYFDAKGIMQTASAGEIAIDYDPATGECLGPQIEAAATNLLEQSEDFSNAAWSKTGVGITANDAIAPDGANTADAITEDTGTSTHRLSRSETFTNGITYTFSVYAKVKSGSRLLHVNLVNAFNARTFFDLSTGAVHSTVNGTANIQELPNGWYRCSVTGTSTGHSGSFYPVGLADGTTENYTGDGTSGLYIWGAQLEVGSAPSSYIPTTTAAVTRNADVMSMTGTDFSEWYRQGVGTILAEFSVFVGGDKNTFQISSGDLWVDGIVHAAAWLVKGTVIGDYIGWPSNLNTPIKDALAWQDGDQFRATSLGDTATATVDLSSMVAHDRFYLSGRDGNNRFLNGHIQRVRYYPQRLTNTQLIALTRS